MAVLTKYDIYQWWDQNFGCPMIEMYNHLVDWGRRLASKHCSASEYALFFETQRVRLL